MRGTARRIATASFVLALGVSLFLYHTDNYIPGTPISSGTWATQEGCLKALGPVPGATCELTGPDRDAWAFASKSEYRNSPNVTNLVLLLALWFGAYGVTALVILSVRALDGPRPQA